MQNQRSSDNFIFFYENFTTEGLKGHQQGLKNIKRASRSPCRNKRPSLGPERPQQGPKSCPALHNKLEEGACSALNLLLLTICNPPLTLPNRPLCLPPKSNRVYSSFTMSSYCPDPVGGIQICKAKLYDQYNNSQVHPTGLGHKSSLLMGAGNQYLNLV